MKMMFYSALAVVLISFVTEATAQVVEKTTLTLEGAKRVMAAAEAKAKTEGARVVIAVVDDGGSLLLLERLDDTQIASVNVGIDKARTAAIYRRPSKVFEDQVKNGRVSALALSSSRLQIFGLFQCPLTVTIFGSSTSPSWYVTWRRRGRS